MGAHALRHPVGHVSALIAAAALIFGPVMSVGAKIPPFGMEVDVDDTRATVTLTLEQEGFDPPNLTGLVAIYPSSVLDHEGRPTDPTSRVEVPLTRIAAGTYQGTVRLEGAGPWAAVPFPNVMSVTAADLDPYPMAVHFETATGSALPLVAAGGSVAAVVALAALAIRRRARWHPVLAATLALALLGVTAVAFPVAREGTFECPITIPPQPGYSPPEPYSVTYPDDGSIWYGTQGLWTVLPVDGDYQPRKSLWWSTNFPGGHEEERPDLHVTWTRLDTDEPIVINNQGQATNAHTAQDGWFMIAGIDPDAAKAELHQSGCWEVTATYKGTALTYVYERP